MNYLADTHCHLYFPELTGEFEKVLSRSWDSKVCKILVPSIDLATIFDSLSISEKYPELIYSAAGIHPNYAGYIHSHEMDLIRSLLEQRNFVAIGEIGLDFYRDYCPESIQIDIFQKMLNLAFEFDLPVCLHNRDAENTLLPILTQWVSQLKQSDSCLKENPGVFHAFNGSENVAGWAMENNFKLGIGGLVTYKKSRQLRNLVTKLPLDLFILETDAPFLAPSPMRNEINQPANISIIANEVSKLKGLPVNKIMLTTSINANNLFRWDREKEGALGGS